MHNTGANDIFLLNLNTTHELMEALLPQQYTLLSKDKIMAQQLVTPEEVLKAQGSASTTRLAICVGVVFLHGMMCGASLGYGGTGPASPP